MGGSGIVLGLLPTVATMRWLRVPPHNFERWYLLHCCSPFRLNTMQTVAHSEGTERKESGLLELCGVLSKMMKYEHARRGERRLRC